MVTLLFYSVRKIKLIFSWLVKGQTNIAEGSVKGQTNIASRSAKGQHNFVMDQLKSWRIITLTTSK